MPENLCRIFSRWWIGCRVILMGIICLFAGAFCFYANAEDMRFPDGASIVDVKRDYGAKGDGKTDDTNALQKALFERKGIIYLPNGSYLVSRTLKWGPENARDGEQGNAWKRTILQGQSREGTVIQLAAAADGFQNPQEPRPVVWTGQAPAQRFRNGVYNLTIDTGKKNPGAIGAQFIANNQGGIEGVTIRSGDGDGVIGLDLGYTDEQGPCLIKDVAVEGYDIGIRTKHAVCGVTLEEIHLSGQKIFGMLNEGQCVSLRGLKSENAVPAYKNAAIPSLTVMIDSELVGTKGASGQAAVLNEGGMLLRNVKTKGYGWAIKSPGVDPAAHGPDIMEFISDGGHTLFGQKVRALNLPVKETPKVPWDIPETWADVTQFGPVEKVELTHLKTGKKEIREDWTGALQRAIDSGARTVFFPYREGEGYTLTGTVRLRGKVRRIIGCEATLGRLVDSNEQKTAYAPETARPLFILEEGEAPAVVVERFNSWFTPLRFEQRSKRSLVLKHISIYDLETYPGTGDVFLEDVRGKSLRIDQSRVWARQFNPEGHEEPRIQNQGGDFWVLGLKTENDATVLKVNNGGRAEVLGGFGYANKDKLPFKQYFINDNASLSATFGGWKTKSGRAFDVIVTETQGGETRQLKKSEVGNRGYSSFVVLYSGSRP